jgi:hypothetical protein
VVNQVGNDFGVGLAQEHIALGLQFTAQFFVVLDDAVVNQGNAAWLGGGSVSTGPCEKCGWALCTAGTP